MVDIEYLKTRYFYLDEPVKYKLKDNEINIYPIQLKDSEFFLSSVGILTVDKNSNSSIEIIQMSYLKFIVVILFQDEVNIQKLLNILILCLKLKKPQIITEDEKFYIIDKELGIKINQKEFDDIKRIILYQNFPGYDDEYIDPNFKKNMDEKDQLRNKGLISPNLERKIAIITSHTGLSKKEQLDMTYRSHSILFAEVYEEIKYNVIMPIAIYSGQADKFDNWIFKKKKGKFDDYVVNVDEYKKSMGNNSTIKQTSNTFYGDNMDVAFNNFYKE
jgi:hypothetical protein